MQRQAGYVEEVEAGPPGMAGARPAHQHRRLSQASLIKKIIKILSFLDISTETRPITGLYLIQGKN